MKPIVLDQGEVHEGEERAAEAVITVEAAGMGGALGLEAGTASTDGLGAVALPLEPLDQLTIDGLAELTGVADGRRQRGGARVALGAALGGERGAVLAHRQLRLRWAVAVAFVAEH